MVYALLSAQITTAQKEDLGPSGKHRSPSSSVSGTLCIINRTNHHIHYQVRGGNGPWEATSFGPNGWNIHHSGPCRKVGQSGVWPIYNCPRFAVSFNTSLVSQNFIIQNLEVTPTERSNCEVCNRYAFDYVGGSNTEVYLHVID